MTLSTNLQVYSQRFLFRLKCFVILIIFCVLGPVSKTELNFINTWSVMEISKSFYTNWNMKTIAKLIVSLGETNPASNTKKVRIKIEDTRYLFNYLLYLSVIIIYKVYPMNKHGTIC